MFDSPMTATGISDPSRILLTDLTVNFLFGLFWKAQLGILGVHVSLPGPCAKMSAHCVSKFSLGLKECNSCVLCFMGNTGVMLKFMFASFTDPQWILRNSCRNPLARSLRLNQWGLDPSRVWPCVLWFIVEYVYIYTGSSICSLKKWRELNSCRFNILMTLHKKVVAFQKQK